MISTTTDFLPRTAVAMTGFQTGSQCLKWKDSFRRYLGRLINLDGEITESTNQLISATNQTPSANQSPQAVSNGENQLFVWLDASKSALTGALIRNSKPVLSSSFIVAENDASNASAFTLVSNDEGFVILDGTSQLRAKSVNRDGILGQALDVDDITVSGVGAASNSGSYLVAFTSEGKVYGRLLDRALAAGQRTTIAAPTTAARDPAVAFDGNRYLVAWRLPGVGAIRAA